MRLRVAVLPLFDVSFVDVPIDGVVIDVSDFELSLSSNFPKYHREAEDVVRKAKPRIT